MALTIGTRNAHRSRLRKPNFVRRLRLEGLEDRRMVSPLDEGPGIQIVKFVNGQDADAPTGPHVAAGSTVTFTYVVTNTGGGPLAHVAVTDDTLGAISSFTGDTNNNGLLDTNETWTYTQTTTALAGQQTNVGTA